MPKPNTKSLLKEIQSGDLEQVYMHVSNKAIEWMVAGFIEKANLLLTHLWSYNLPHSRHLWLPDEGLQVMWEVTKTKPASIPFILKPIEDIETTNWDNLMFPSYHESFLERFKHRNIEELSGVELYAKAILSSPCHCRCSSQPSHCCPTSGASMPPSLCRLAYLCLAIKIIS